MCVSILPEALFSCPDSATVATAAITIITTTIGSKDYFTHHWSEGANWRTYNIGISTDNPNTECQVYSDWNDQKPFGKAVAAGKGGPNDYSEWTFTYTSAYHLIKNGTNNLTSKISCTDGPASNITKWNSVNVTGIDGLVCHNSRQ